MNNIPKCINIVNNSQMFLVIFKLIKIGYNISIIIVNIPINIKINV